MICIAAVVVVSDAVDAVIVVAGFGFVDADYRFHRNTHRLDHIPLHNHHCPTHSNYRHMLNSFFHQLFVDFK